MIGTKKIKDIVDVERFLWEGKTWKIADDSFTTTQSESEHNVWCVNADGGGTQHVLLPLEKVVFFEVKGDK